MRRPLIAGNWKMNGSKAANQALVAGLTQAPTSVERVLCPPAAYLQQVASLIEGSDMVLGAQNIDWRESGAVTGEISAGMVRDLGAEYVIVGHSERRGLFGETPEDCLKKTEAAIAQALTPIFCVGELKQEREQGDTASVIEAQLADLLETVELSKLVIAYEPVWAIGTGEVATPEQAAEVHRLIRKQVAARDKLAAQDMRILYGGSVNGKNASGLLAMADIDGALVGGASLKAEEFSTICHAAELSHSSH